MGTATILLLRAEGFRQGMSEERKKPVAVEVGFAVLVGIATGIGAAFLFVLVYAVAELYLSGHSIKPAWFDPAADIAMLVVVFGTACGTAALTWRARRPR